MCESGSNHSVTWCVCAYVCVSEQALYLAGGVSEEAADVRNDFTERQTLRAKPERSKHKTD